jgi:NAD-dependent DNA ligase
MAVAAYAYEFMDSPIISDAEFDQESLKINPQIDTGRPELDHFFRTEFHPDTGGWIHRHPELEKVAQTYHRWYK